LIDFGESVQLCNEDIYNIKDEYMKKQVYSIPTLAFQCKIAKIHSPINRQFNDGWSEEINTYNIVGKLLQNAKGTVSLIIILILTKVNHSFNKLGMIITTLTF